MRIRRLICLLSFLFPLVANSNAQDVRWVNSIISEGYDDCHDLHVDRSGNVYATGQIEYTAYFNDGSHLSSSGSHDIFAAKYDSSGNRIWAKRAGGTDGDIGMSIAADYLGNAYVVGEFEQTSQFGSITKIAQGSNNIFVAKYDPAGTIEWVRSIGTNSGSTKGYAVTCDSLGNVYASGTVTARAYYNGSTLFSSRGHEDILLIKFDTQGNKKWDERIGGSDADFCYGLATTGDKLYVTGSFEGTTRFTSSNSLHSDGGSDFFLAQYDTLGNFNWAEAGGGSGSDIGWDVTINTNGQIVCTGGFKGHGTFGSNSINSDGSSDVFIVAYDSLGNNLWARHAGGNNIDFGKGISHDYNGNILITGNYIDDALFDTVTLINNGDEDVFLASYDSSGNFRFAKGFGDSDHDLGDAIGADKYGNIYFSGEFRDEIDFDSIHVDGDDFNDAFLVRLGNFPVCSLSTSMSDASCFSGCDGSATITPNGLPPFIYEWTLFPQLHSNVASGLCMGAYPVDVTDAFGCTMSAVVEINQPGAVTIFGSVVSNTTCATCSDGSISFSTSGGNGTYLYQWNDGATSEDRANLYSGIYSVCVTDGNGCSYCDTFSVLAGPVGIDELNSSLMKIFPNPSSGLVFLDLDKTLKSKQLRLGIYDLVGKKIRSIPIVNEMNTFSVNEFLNGLYFLQLIDDESGEIIGASRLIVSK